MRRVGVLEIREGSRLVRVLPTKRGTFRNVSPQHLPPVDGYRTLYCSPARYRQWRRAWRRWYRRRGWRYGYAPEMWIVASVLDNASYIRYLRWREGWVRLLAVLAVLGIAAVWAWLCVNECITP